MKVTIIIATLFCLNAVAEEGPVYNFNFYHGDKSKPGETKGGSESSIVQKLSSEEKKVLVDSLKEELKKEGKPNELENMSLFVGYHYQLLKGVEEDFAEGGVVVRGLETGMGFKLSEASFLNIILVLGSIESKPGGSLKEEVNTQKAKIRGGAIGIDFFSNADQSIALGYGGEIRYIVGTKWSSHSEPSMDFFQTSFGGNLGPTFRMGNTFVDLRGRVEYASLKTEVISDRYSGGDKKVEGLSFGAVARFGVRY